MTTLRAVLAALVVLASAGCAADTDVPPTGTSAETNYARLPDGAVPRTGDEGLPFVTARSVHVLAPPTTDNGVLVGNLPDDMSASYLQQELRGKVVRVGAVFAFRSGATGDGGNGSLCLAAWVTPIVTPTAPVPDSPFHLVVTPTSAGLTYWEDGRQSADLFRVSFRDVLPMNGTPLRIEIVVDGDRATVTLPDGSVQTVENEQIQRLAGPTANWEYFKYGKGDASVILYRTWADAKST